MRILALETSTMVGSTAIVEDGVVRSEIVARVPSANHSDVVLAWVNDALVRAGRSLDELDAFAVGIGPGSFTGVRIGVSTAKGLRVATGKPLFGVGSLDALVAAAVGVRGFVSAVLDARRGEVFASLVRVGVGARRELLEPGHMAPDAMGARLREAAGEEEIFAIGDLDDAQWRALESGAGGGVARLPRLVGTPLARFVALEVEAGRAVRDDDALEPRYVRPSDAKLPTR